MHTQSSLLVNYSLMFCPLMLCMLVLLFLLVRL